MISASAYSVAGNVAGIVPSQTGLRRYTAAERNDKRAEMLQDRNWPRLVKATMEQKSRTNAVWQSLLAHLERSGIKGKPWHVDYDAFLASLKKDGFPAKEVAIMRAFGLTELAIDLPGKQSSRNSM